MNAIASRIKIDFYNNLTKSARFFFQEYDIAVNGAIQQFIDEKMGDEENRSPENFQWIQAIRDDLRNLIANASPTITNGSVITNEYFSITPSHINFPDDYYTFVRLFVLIDGISKYSRPTSYNLSGPLFEDSFKHPTNKRTYYNEDSTGLLIYRGVGGTFTSATLTYIKNPTSFTIGREGNIISPGPTALVNGSTYIATEDSTQGFFSYQAGVQFVSAGTALDTGAVILASLTTAIDLPERVQDDICRRASVIMLKNISMFENAVAVDSQLSKP